MHGRVTSTEQLTPGMVRVVLGGGDLEHLAMPDATDAYVNVAFRPALRRTTRSSTPRRCARPLPRRSGRPGAATPCASWDAETRELVLDFVVHADEGWPARWALNAQPGDVLVFEGPSGDYRPTPAADWHLLVGDESALPAIAASLEAMTSGERAVVRLVCDGPGAPGRPDHPADLDLEWLHRAR